MVLVEKEEQEQEQEQKDEEGKEECKKMTII